MRKFSKSETKYFEFQIEGDEKVYRIPLAADIPYVTLRKMNETGGTTDGFEVQVEMLRRYMGDAVDDMSAGMLSDILNAWVDESRDAGATLGES